MEGKTLAIFENVVTKERKPKRKVFRPHRFPEEESSPSESELVIDEEFTVGAKRKKSEARVRLKEEVLSLTCLWNDCFRLFTCADLFLQHLLGHLNDDFKDFRCHWTDCPSSNIMTSTKMFQRHLAYHAYLSKLVCIGENVLKRNKLPDCALTKDYSVDVPTNDYVCEWQDCMNLSFNTLQEFLGHVECHVQAAPSGKKQNQVVEIPCEWSGCGGTFSNRYKLADHLKIHTKERIIACPQCMALFSSKTTFSDHRKRQVSIDMRSYQCSQCLKLFSDERLLSDHMRSHINQYKCTMCDMTATKPSMLAKHYRFKHMDVRPFSCNLCQKTFVTNSNLNTHLTTHQDKPFKCVECDFGCKSKVGLKSHMNKVHGLESNLYECQMCKKRFRRGDSLTCHLIKSHNFHWPPGHSRFRYRKDSDGIRRLQTVRYESLEVTEQMIKSESMQPQKKLSAVTYNVTYDKDAVDQYKLTVVENNVEQEVEFVESSQSGAAGDNIVIIIEDVDERGKVLQRRQIDSNEVLLYDLADRKEAKRDMPKVGSPEKSLNNDSS